MCNGVNHNLVKILSAYKDGYADVVRWCKDCGAVVVDRDFDNRTNPGAVAKMRLPTNTNHV